jgi:transcriptional regulator with XRE-family HTH domain
MAFRRIKVGEPGQVFGPAALGRRNVMPRTSDPYDAQVGHRVRALRLARGLSQAELGAALGVSFQQVQKYEKGVNRISAGRLRRIGELFDVPLTSFLGEQPRKVVKPDRTFEFLGELGAIELLQAYALIRQRGVRRGLVRLAQQIARGK